MKHGKIKVLLFSKINLFSTKSMTMISLKSTRDQTLANYLNQHALYQFLENSQNYLVVSFAPFFFPRSEYYLNEKLLAKPQVHLKQLVTFWNSSCSLMRLNLGHFSPHFQLESIYLIFKFDQQVFKIIIIGRTRQEML